MEEAKARASATEQKVFSRFDDCMRTWTEDVGRPRFVKDKIWEMLQSSDTKTLKLTKYFEELLDKARQTGWLGRDKPGENLEES